MSYRQIPCFTQFIALFIIVAAYALSMTGCSGTTGEDNPVTPVKELSVSTTYPLNGGVGPFDLYVPGPGLTKPHFTVQFSKLLELSSFTSQTVTVQGFNEDVLVVTDPANSHGNVVAFRIIRKLNPAAKIPVRFRIGATYAVTVDSLVEAYDGQKLGRDFRFSFTPEPAFRLTGMSFTDGDSIVPASIEIFFNNTLAAASAGAVAVSPAIAAVWGPNPLTDSCSLVANTFGKTAPSNRYIVSVAQSAADRDGRMLAAASQRSFIAPSVRIARNQFASGNTNVSMATRIFFSFNYPMDTVSLRTAFRFNPPTPIDLTIGQSELSFTAVNDLQPATDYSVQFNGPIRTASGVVIPSPDPLTFRTASFSMTHTPADGATGLSTYTIVQLTFSSAIKASFPEGTITFDPPVPHRLQFEGDTPGKDVHIYCIPDNPLPRGTQFTIRIQNTIQSVGGYFLAQPDSFTFRTGF